MAKQQFLNCKWGYKESLFTAGSFFVSDHMIGRRLHQYHFFFARIAQYGVHKLHPHYIWVQLPHCCISGINWFSCLQIYICPKYFYREQYLSTWGKLLRRKNICWYVDIEDMLGILSGGSITTFWFAVDLALFVHGWKLNWKM